MELTDGGGDDASSVDKTVDPAGDEVGRASAGTLAWPLEEV